MNNLPHSDTSSLKRRFFATYYDTPARVVYGGEDLHIECDGWYPGLLEGDLTSYYLLVEPNDCKYPRYCDKDLQRSKGKATGFMGHSTQQLIDLGWIKIKQ